MTITRKQFFATILAGPAAIAAAWNGRAPGPDFLVIEQEMPLGETQLIRTIDLTPPTLGRDWVYEKFVQPGWDEHKVAALMADCEPIQFILHDELDLFGISELPSLCKPRAKRWQTLSRAG